MHIYLNQIVPEVAFDQDPEALVIHLARKNLPDNYRENTIGLQTLDEKRNSNGIYWEMVVRPALTLDPARQERWELKSLLINGEMTSPVPIQIDVQLPCYRPRITITLGKERVVVMTLTRPFDAWDGHNVISSVSTIYDRLQDEHLFSEASELHVDAL